DPRPRLRTHPPPSPSSVRRSGGCTRRRGPPARSSGTALKNPNRATEPLALRFQRIHNLIRIHKFRTFYTPGLNPKCVAEKEQLAALVFIATRTKLARQSVRRKITCHKICPKVTHTR